MAKLKVQEASAEKASWVQPQSRILVVDDEEMICSQLKRLLTHSGYSVVTVASAEEGLEILRDGDIDLVVTDMRLPGMSGVELTHRLRESHPDVSVIVITGYADIETAVEILKLGASDYIIKPFSVGAIQNSIRTVLQKAGVFMEIRHLRRYLKDRYEFGGILSKTAEMHKVFETVRMVSSTDMTVLIEGETGTGKELLAGVIHYQSPRREGPLVTINCAGVPETLLESELFGYERGAFTGADQARAGKIELAQNGTLFLDEIESISLAMQAKLLRVLEDQKIQRLGGTRWTQINMRVVAASNIPLKELVAQGKMRRDFYYRVNVIPILLPPLRERREDIPLLVQDFLHHHPVAIRKQISRISKLAMNQLMKHSWPGNIRELQNVLERAIVLCAGPVIESVDLEDTELRNVPAGDSLPPRVPLREWLIEQEKRYLLQQLEASGCKISLTARNIGVDVKTLYRKMRQYGLNKRDFQDKGSSASSPEDENSVSEKDPSLLPLRGS